MFVADKKFAMLNAFLKPYEGLPIAITMQGGQTILLGKGAPQFSIFIHKQLSEECLFPNAAQVLANAYMAGELTVNGDLQELISLLIQNGNVTQQAFHSFISNLPIDTATRKQKDVFRFFQSWMDQAMSNFSGDFQKGAASFHDAQAQGLKQILDALHLKKGMTVLDLHCGWGNLLIEAAKRYKIKGIGFTHSEHQRSAAQRKINFLGLESQLQVKIFPSADVKKLLLFEKSVDRIVSVDLLEQLKRSQQHSFADFSIPLRSSGFCLYRSIVFPEDAKKYAGEQYAFTQSGRFKRKAVRTVHNDTQCTLQCWIRNLQQQKNELISIFGQSIVRLWEIYLCCWLAYLQSGAAHAYEWLLEEENIVTAKR